MPRGFPSRGGTNVGQAIWRQYLTAVRTRATLRTTPALPRIRTRNRTTLQETLR